MRNFLSVLEKRIEQAKQKNQFRKLIVPPDHLTDFTSNDYLGLARSFELADFITEETRNLKIRNGSTGSRLLTGNSSLLEETEVFLSELFKSESALICNSGYSANVAVLSSLPQKNDTILYDEFAHASIKDGVRLSLANRFSFSHNNLDDLKKKLQRSTGNKFIVIESIYSMDGDASPLQEIANLAKKYESVIILDEAHSTGIMGDGGSGMTTALGLEHDVDVRIYTFGKAMGVHGACVTGNQLVRDFLINFSRPFIYTTALSPHSILSIACAFRFLQKNTILRSQLNENIKLFKSLCSYRTTSHSPIQPISIPGNDAVKRIALQLQQAGFDVRPILSPTVKEGSERLRLCMHAFNTKEEIYQLSETLNKNRIN